MSKPLQFSKDFKIQAIKQHREGLTPHAIFKLHGYDLSTMNRKIPKNCLYKWNKIYKEEGEAGLQKKRSGREKGSTSKTVTFKDDKEKIAYLELQVAYLKKENDFLVKLRAQKKKE
jgi:transposase-like protein